MSIDLNDNVNVEELNSSKDDNDNKNINYHHDDNSISEENSEDGLIYIIF